MAETKEDKRDAAVRKIVADACRRERDNDKAVALAVQMFKRSGRLYGEIAGQLIADAMRHRINDWRHTQLSELKAIHCDAPRSDRSPAAQKRVSEVAAKSSLLDLWTVRGVRLGDIKGEALPALAADAFENAKGNTINGLFYTSLREYTPDGKSVRKCVTPAQASAILKRASEAAGHCSAGDLSKIARRNGKSNGKGQPNIGSHDRPALPSELSKAGDHTPSGAQVHHVPGPDTSEAAGHKSSGTQAWNAAASDPDLADGHGRCDPHDAGAVGEAELAPVGK